MQGGGRANRRKSREIVVKQVIPAEPEEAEEQLEPGGSLESLYEGLPEPAGELFGRMSFFPGGLFKGFDDLWELLGDDWSETVEELVDAGLVQYDKARDRYTKPRPVMDFACEKLDEGEGDDFRRRTTEFWVEFARWHDLMLDIDPDAQEAAGQKLDLPDDPEERRQAEEALRADSFAMLALEEKNLVHAAEWALAAGDESGLGLVDSLEDYLELRKRWYTKERLYLMALARRRQFARINTQEYLPDVAATLNSIGAMYSQTGHQEEALTYLQEALGIRRRLLQSQPDIHRPDLAVTLNNMGGLLADMGRCDEACEHYREALDIYRALFRRYPSTYARNLLATLRNIMEAYEKLEMEEKADECREEIEKMEQLLS